MRRTTGTTKAAALASRLRQTILSNGLAPGDAMPSELELIERHGLSRATVREALRILDAEGFIDVRVGRHGGIVVAHPHPDQLGTWLATQLTLRAVTVDSLIEFRVLVEPIAAEVAAARATDDDLRLLEETLCAETAEEELDFHLIIADATHNELLRLLLRSVHTGLRDHAFYGEGATEKDAAAGRRDHRRIFDAISRRDPLGAAGAMRSHLEGVARVVRRSGRVGEVLLPPSAWRTSADDV